MEGRIGLQPDTGLSPALRACIEANQATLSKFVPSSDPVEDTPAIEPDEDEEIPAEEFYARMKEAMIEAVETR
jgi:hypothetical protein